MHKYTQCVSGEECAMRVEYGLTELIYVIVAGVH